MRIYSNMNMINAIENVERVSLIWPLFSYRKWSLALTRILMKITMICIIWNWMNQTSQNIGFPRCPWSVNNIIIAFCVLVSYINKIRFANLNKGLLHHSSRRQTYCLLMIWLNEISQRLDARLFRRRCCSEIACEMNLRDWVRATLSGWKSIAGAIALAIYNAASSCGGRVINKSTSARFIFSALDKKGFIIKLAARVCV